MSYALINPYKHPGAAPPGGFVPTDLTDLRLWLDAADASTILEATTEGRVSQWNNKGPTGGGVAQGLTPSLQPVTGVSTLNGLNVVDFAGYYMTSGEAASAWKFMHDGTKHHVWLVTKLATVDDPNAAYGVLGTAGATSTSHGEALVFDDRSASSRNDRIWHAVHRNAGSYQTFNMSGDDAFNANEFALLELASDPGNATTADRSAMRRNSGTVIKNNADTGAVSTSNPSFTLQVGSIGDNFGPLHGAIAELVIAVDPTGAEITDTRTYLAERWGITL